MTRKDFEAIAKAVGCVRSLRTAQYNPDVLAGVDLMVVAIMDVCENRNDNFDEVRFLRACGMSQEVKFIRACGV